MPCPLLESDQRCGKGLYGYAVLFPVLTWRIVSTDMLCDARLSLGSWSFRGCYALPSATQLCSSMMIWWYQAAVAKEGGIRMTLLAMKNHPV